MGRGWLAGAGGKGGKQGEGEVPRVAEARPSTVRRLFSARPAHAPASAQPNPLSTRTSTSTRTRTQPATHACCCPPPRMDRRLPSSFGAAPRLSASSSSSSSTPASASQPLRRPSISTSTSASYAHVAPTPSRSTLDRRPSASSLGGGVGSSGSAIPRPGAAAVPATPSSRIPFGSKRPLSSTGPSSTDEPPSTLRRTNPSSAVQADLERRLAASAERVRELERVREEGQREVDEVRNMMRLLVADDEGRAREAQEAAERQADELVRPTFLSRSLFLGWPRWPLRRPTRALARCSRSSPA